MSEYGFVQKVTIAFVSRGLIITAMLLPATEVAHCLFDENCDHTPHIETMVSAATIGTPSL